MNRLLLALVLIVCTQTSFSARASETNSSAIVNFSRIIHGWTNYSTGFTATIDTDPAAGDFATLASFYTPEFDVVPVDYGVVVVWLGAQSQHFDWSNFDFRVGIWSSLPAFITSPTTGDVATVFFNAPTGGSTSTRDATTRGGRPAYYLRFCLTNTPVTLRADHTYLVGFAASTFVWDNGELFVPTAPTSGPSDVQAGDLVPGGWTYLTNAGGLTIYSGQLATELLVTPLPQLRIRALTNEVEISWPASLTGVVVESTLHLERLAVWSSVNSAPQGEGTWKRVNLPNSSAAQRFFRLRMEAP